MDAVTYFKEMKRMCNYYDCDCSFCPLNDKDSLLSCSDTQMEDTDRAVAIVQKWADEHEID